MPHLALAASLAALLPLISPFSTDPAAASPLRSGFMGAGAWPVPLHPVQHSIPFEGTYLGYWHDGRALFETVAVISPDLLTLTRHDHTAQPVAFLRVAPGRYRAAGGHMLTVLSPTALRWQDTAGGEPVIYTWQR